MTTEYDRKIPDAVCYDTIFENGVRPYHRVALYATYSCAEGAKGKLLEFEGTIAQCLKEMRKWPISKEQVARVHVLMSERQGGIITSELKFHNC